MSKIEQALKKFQEESKREAEQPPAPAPTPEKHSHAALPGQNTPDKKTNRQKGNIISAIEKSKNDNKAILDYMSQLDVQGGSVSKEDAVSLTEETDCREQNKKKPFLSTTIDTFNVNEHIVSYYCAIDKPTWKGPVMVHFKRLQLSLSNMQKNDDCKVILFTSSTQNEGKSTISINIAISLCSDQKSRVAFIDCDFRKPSLIRMLGLAPGKGLADYLAGEAGTDEITFDGLVPGLTLIPAGNKQTKVFELLGSDRMKEFFTYLKKHFDYVIVDTPPVLAFPDTAILAPLVDGVVFVINCRKAKKPVVKRAVETLNNCKIMGFVMNKNASAAVDYYGYTSGYAYYDCGSE
ncbi:MAG: CpsD/CapB family tyrosine-protein kinase [Candidatus Scalindua rubra]|uniref:non-specific protein-tyrosine kinase n=1 Tax=Candidatus Scalindua brodae TaxID=237368 RepID=A0A0B0EEM6_9BACT|nr:MAG: lipopolysaccharide biosynthesis protein [Candidatus Scalindua brodae]MBZ0109700.1 CpsD/CapB family tyrosine-protein kinase [Candidatus Scalindua rubra]TWU32429.1 Tyrosine-protein kinase YwqD [Candidatus Brocadiaceae bacterium S225]